MNLVPTTVWIVMYKGGGWACRDLQFSLESAQDQAERWAKVTGVKTEVVEALIVMVRRE